MPTDTEIIDWLEEKGNGIGLVNDDEGAWAVAGTGSQNIRSTAGVQPAPLMTTYFIEPEWFKPTVREAVAYAMEHWDEYEIEREEDEDNA